MRQLVQDPRSGEVEVVDLPDPSPGTGEVLVRTTWSLISPGTEQSVAETAAKSPLGKARERPDLVRKIVEKAAREGVESTVAAVRARLDDLLTPGYSSAGVVEHMDRSVEGLQVGQRVGCVGANVACHAERVVVPAALCVPLPSSLDERWGAFGALGAVAAHGVRIAEVDAGSRIVVLGLGLVGQLTAQLVTAAGARAIGLDLSADKAALAKRLGAVVTGTVTSDGADKLVREATDGVGADAVIIAAATKDNRAIELASALARDRAIIAAVGDVRLDVPRREFYGKELQLRVSRSYGPGRYDREYEQEGRDYPLAYVRWTQRRLIQYFFEEVAAGRVRLDELVTHEFSVEEGRDAYEALASKSRMAILLRYRPDGPDRKRRTIVHRGPLVRTGRLRVALIGPGLFARTRLLPELQKLDVEVVGIAGGAPARAVGVARRWSASFAASDPNEVLEDPSVDAVVIATRHDSHADLAARALQRGKGVFLEKPLAIDENALAELRAQLQMEGQLVVDFNRSFAPSTSSLVRHWRERSDPLLIQYRIDAGYLQPDHWLRDPRVGGGRLVGEACHFVDLCSAVVSERLQSVQTVSLGTGPNTLPGDSFVLVLRYEAGSVATVSYVSGADSGLAKERIEILGGRRSAVVDDFRRVALFAGGRRVGGRRLPLQDKGHGAALAAAVHFFRHGGPPPIPYERAFETTQATLLAREALARGSTEPASLPPV